MSRESDLAWAAGLFEGEGTAFPIQNNRATPRTYLQLAIQMCDKDVLEKFRDIVGAGQVRGPYVCNPPDPKRKPKWAWSVAGEKAMALVTDPAFGQYLCSRRSARIREIVADIEAQEPIAPKPPKVACIHGHPYTPENSGYYKDQRYCRTCSRTRKRTTDRKRYWDNIERERAAGRERYHRQQQAKREREGR